MSHVGEFSVKIKACLKSDIYICSVGQLQTITVANPCIGANIVGPNIHDFIALIGTTNQISIAITSEFDLCQEYDLYDIEIETEDDQDGPS